MKKFIFLIALLLLAGLLFFILSTLPKIQTKTNSESTLIAPSIQQSNQCTDGKIEKCNLGSCSGTKTCLNGKFTECNLNIVCTTGSKVSCVENACASGYKICNSCGTGYSECSNN